MENTNAKNYATKLFLEQIKSMTLESIEKYVTLDIERNVYVLNGQIYNELCTTTINNEIKREELSSLFKDEFDKLKSEIDELRIELNQPRKTYVVSSDTTTADEFNNKNEK